ncbi:DUF3048 domain-containing protein [Patescibacteria group bacterium]|nr:DUF3048 domain-containing protein [Patescibacteria group bacterium]
MEGKFKNRESKISPELLLKRYWPYLSVAVIIIVAISYGLFHYAITRGDDPEPDQNATTTTQIQEHEWDGLYDRQLDGFRVSEEEASLIPRAVMIENHVDARPLSGVSKASVVFEAPVEGGITRMLVVFDATTTVEKIGPVRSARPYFVEIAQALNAMYVHVGGSPEALNRIGGLSNFYNLDEMAGESYFWRASNRYAPHNAYTNSDNLNEAEQDKKWMARKFTAWSFDDPESNEFGDVREVQIPYDGSYKVKWVFDERTGLYQRYLGGTIQKDLDGSFVTSKNIVVLESEQRVLDDYGRLFVRTTGEGKAWVYQNGYAQEGKWKRQSSNFFEILTPDDNDISLSRGNTWVEFATLEKYQPIEKVSSLDE